jgi:hypothetical protein
MEALKHPLRAALIAWGAMSVLVLAVWPFTPFGSSFLALGIGYSALLAGLACGMALLPHKVMQTFLWLSTAAFLPVSVMILSLLYWASLSPENAGAFLRVHGVVFSVVKIGLGLVLVAMTVASISGWVWFFRKGRPSSSPT